MIILGIPILWKLWFMGFQIAEEGFEPPTPRVWTVCSRQLSYSAVFWNTLRFPQKWDLQGSNLWPSACKADALPAELRSHGLQSVVFPSTACPLYYYFQLLVNTFFQIFFYFFLQAGFWHFMVLFSHDFMDFSHFLRIFFTKCWHLEKLCGKL